MPLTTLDNLHLSKKILDWRNLMFDVELQIQQLIKQHYKCRLAGGFAALIVERLTLGGICNAAHNTGQFVIVQIKRLPLFNGFYGKGNWNNWK
jgi:hypothetical protein